MSASKAPTSLDELKRVLQDDIKVKVAGKRGCSSYFSLNIPQELMVCVIAPILLDERISIYLPVDGVLRGKFMVYAIFLADIRVLTI
jgi:hypothetical protein